MAFFKLQTGIDRLNVLGLVIATIIAALFLGCCSALVRAVAADRPKLCLYRIYDKTGMFFEFGIPVSEASDLTKKLNQAGLKYLKTRSPTALS